MEKKNVLEKINSLVFDHNVLTVIVSLDNIFYSIDLAFIRLKNKYIKK